MLVDFAWTSQTYSIYDIIQVCLILFLTQVKKCCGRKSKKKRKDFEKLQPETVREFDGNSSANDLHAASKNLYILNAACKSAIKKSIKR